MAADMTTDPGASHLEGSPFRRLLLERTPRVIATPALIVANVLIYAATAGASGQTEPRPDVLVGWGALFGPGVANGEWWRLVSAMFLHAGILHIALNCLFLRQIGNLVERLMGSFAFLTIYLVTGVTGAMASLMAHPRSIGVGASGALFGITGTLLAVVLSSGGQMRELLDDRPISVGLGRPDAEQSEQRRRTVFCVCHGPGDARRPIHRVWEGGRGHRNRSANLGGRGRCRRSSEVTDRHQIGDDS